MAEEQDHSSVLKSFDEVFAKLRVWAPAALAEIGAKPADIEKINFLLKLDTLVHIGALKQHFHKHSQQLLSKNAEYVRDVILPPEYRTVEIPQHLLDKGFLYVEVIAELLEQLEKLE